MLSKTTSLLMIPMMITILLMPMTLIALMTPLQPPPQLLPKETRLTEQTILRNLNQRRRRERNSQCHMQ